MKTQVLEKDGKKEFVVLAWDDYRKIQAMIEDYFLNFRDLTALSNGIVFFPFASSLARLSAFKS